MVLMMYNVLGADTAAYVRAGSIPPELRRQIKGTFWTPVLGEIIGMGKRMEWDRRDALPTVLAYLEGQQAALRLVRQGLPESGERTELSDCMKRLHAEIEGLSARIEMEGDNKPRLPNHGYFECNIKGRL